MATLRPKDARGLRDVPIEMLSCIGGFFSQSFCGKVPRNEENLVVQGAASAFKARPVDENIWHLSSHELIDFSESYGSKSCK